MRDFELLEQTWVHHCDGSHDVTILGRHPNRQGWVYYYGHGCWEDTVRLGWDYDHRFIDPEPTITIDGKTYREALPGVEAAMRTFLEQTYTYDPHGTPAAVTILGRYVAIDVPYPNNRGWLYYFGHGCPNGQRLIDWAPDSAFARPEPTVTVDGKTYREADVVERCRELKPL